MKKHNKLISTLLLFAMVFSLFSGIVPVSFAKDEIEPEGGQAKVTITFWDNNGTEGKQTKSVDSGSAAKTLNIKDGQGKLTAPTQDGYSFDGYWDDATAGTQYYKADLSSAFTDNSKKFSADTDLYAHWVKGCTVTIKANYEGGADTSFTAKKNAAIKDAGNIPESAMPTRENYTLVGVYNKSSSSADGAKQYYNGKGVAQDVKGVTYTEDTATLYAVWKEKDSYYVDFNGNGNDGGSMEKQKVYRDVETALTANGFTKTNYHFIGWNTSATGGTSNSSGKKFYSNEQKIKNAVDKDKTLTLFAQWVEDDHYTIKYHDGIDGDEGISGSTADQKAYVGKEVTLTKNGYSRLHYSFVGWNTSKNQSTAVYQDEQAVTFDNAKDTTLHLYAAWQENGSYTVKFNANGASNSMSDQKIYCTEETALKDCTLTYSGKYFKEWNTQADGEGTAYTDKQKVTDLAAKDGSITLYAIWNDYPVLTIEMGKDWDGIADVNDIIITSVKNQGKCEVTFDNTVKNALKKESGNIKYTFVGLYEDAEFTTPFVDNKLNKTELTESKTVYPKWTLEVSFCESDEGQGQESKMANQVFIYGVTQEISKNLFTVNGYTFLKWSTEHKVSDDTKIGVQFFTDEQEILNPTFNRLHARWGTDFEIVFDKNAADATGEMANQKFVTEIAQNLNENEFERECYYFAGWNTKADGKGTSYTDEAEIDTKTAITKLYAQWTPYTYSIVFNANLAGATGETASLTNKNYDEQIKLTKNGFAGTHGETFLGWNTSPDGTGTSFADELYVKNLTKVDKATVNLYAQWQQADKYSISGYVYTDKYVAGGSGDEGPARAVLSLKKLGGQVVYSGLADDKPTTTYKTETASTHRYFAYRFTNLEPGTYQLTATRILDDESEKTETEEIIVVAENMTKDVLLNNVKINSKVIPTATIPTVTDNIQDIAEQRKNTNYSTASSYELKLYVENVNTAVPAQAEDVNKTETFVDNNIGTDYQTQYLNIYLQETVDGGAAVPVTDTGTVIKNTIAFDFSNLAAGTTVHIVRVHEGGDPFEFPVGASNAIGGEYIELYPDESKIIIYAKLYSTYSLVYKTVAPAPIVIRTNPKTGVELAEATEISVPTAEMTVALPRKREELGR